MLPGFRGHLVSEAYLEETLLAIRAGDAAPLDALRRDLFAWRSRSSEVGPASTPRTLLQVRIVEDDRKATAKSVERLMGNKAEARFEFIQERAAFADEASLDV